MNDLPTTSDSSPNEGQLQILASEIQTGMRRQTQPEVRANPALLGECKAATRKQIDRLLKGISHRLKPSERRLIGQWLGIVDIESIVAEAVNITLMEVAKKIDRYEPDRASVMTWVNLILDSRFKDLLRKYRPRYESISIDNTETMVEAEVANIAKPEPESIASKLRQFVETDPEGRLGKHIRDNPPATFQAILLMRLDELTWQEIAKRLNIPSPATANNFHDRELRKWNDYFRKYLSRYRREQS